MNEQQLAAVKQALEALKRMKRYGDTFAYRSSEQNPYDQMCEAITALQSIISQDALHKMAEESRTSGLRLDDWDKIGCVNHDCDKCKAVQEPVAWGWVDGSKLLGSLDHKRLPDYVTPLYTTPPAPQPVPVQEPVGEDAFTFAEDMPTTNYSVRATPQPVPVKTYHDGKPWPVQPSQSAPDYAWPTIEDYEKEVGFEVNDAFKAAWTMARTTNNLFKQMGENT
jgi:hypothetical protein